ncbi:glutaredoxin [Kineobactrum salinum]|nr:glutaredoxin [Kineobactrum salinum]
MFALEWCEFCWSVRKAFEAYGIPYRSVDLDSVAYQENEMGSKLRQALRQRTACNTFPQIFIAGDFIGGCTELFDRCRDGTLFSKVRQLGISCDSSACQDPYTLLPGWLHPR